MAKLLRLGFWGCGVKGRRAAQVGGPFVVTFSSADECAEPSVPRAAHCGPPWSERGDAACSQRQLSPLWHRLTLQLQVGKQSEEDEETQHAHARHAEDDSQQREKQAAQTDEVFGGE